MEHRGASQAAWRKSTYSGGATNCVEVADNVAAAVAVRDSKNPEGSALTFTPGAWDAFTGAVKNGEYATRLGLSARRDRMGESLRAGSATRTGSGGRGGHAAGQFP